MEKVVTKRALATEGIPPLIADREEALATFEEILRRGTMFYPDYDEVAGDFPLVYRVVSLKDS